MKKYGMIKNGNVECVFYSEEDVSAYPDIASLLMEIPEYVQCNWKYDGHEFTDPNDEG